MNYKLTKICTDSISKYLNMDVDEIFNVGDYIAIFGGAVRDSLAQKEIHDVDILCLSESAKKLSEYLENINFLKVDLYDQHQLAMYKEILIINEPWTFIKDKKIIQIIRPVGVYQSLDPTNKNHISYKSLIDSYYSVLSNIDLSCCGVFLERDRDAIIKLKESHPQSIAHCRSCIFEILKKNSMFNQHRTDMRSFKLIDRGWKNINNINKKDVRRAKLKNLETPQKPMYPYKNYNKYVSI